jgi:hypothetical protein
MKNITITLDEEVAYWARIKAAELETSVSKLVGELLKEKMKQEQSYQLAMERFLSKRPGKINEAGDPYPARDEIHER